MGEMLFIGTDLRVAKDPVFIPGGTIEAPNPDKNHAMVTLMTNRKVGDKEYTDAISAHFYGKSASVAANYLCKGKQCNLRGRLQDYTQDTGVVDASGKKIIYRKVEVIATKLELLADPISKMDANIAALKQAGRLVGDVTAKDILPQKHSMVEFNPAAAASTGKYAHATVWTKDRGAWQANGQAVSTPAAGADEVAQLKARLAALEANGAAAGSTASPF